jgi:all-trans-8'-apo-beta-carotenal 15,15'-oxygenase
LSYSAEIEGRLPEGLSGTLYRNGPGLFERDGFRKWNLIDGDGMIRATTFANGRVRFRNHFVRTAKYVAEQKAGPFSIQPGRRRRPASSKTSRAFQAAARPV